MRGGKPTKSSVFELYHNLPCITRHFLHNFSQKGSQNAPCSHLYNSFFRMPNTPRGANGTRPNYTRQFLCDFTAYRVLQQFRRFVKPSCLGEHIQSTIRPTCPCNFFNICIVRIHCVISRAKIAVRLMQLSKIFQVVACRTSVWRRFFMLIFKIVIVPRDYLGEQRFRFDC